jgi:endonuclease-3
LIARKLATTVAKTVAKKAAKKSVAKAKRATKPDPAVVQKTLARLQEAHPDAHCELDHANAFQLLVATVLSAQTTDVAVNKVTPVLFARFPDVRALAQADATRDVEPIINRIGMYRQKAKNIVGLAKKIVGEHGGEVPRSLDALVELPGVGRKTANVVLGVAFGTPEGVVVDTHVQRISQRLGWTKNTEPPKIERDLCALIPRAKWDITSHVLIFHGRRVCFARKPNCEGCSVNDVCPSAGRAETVGRKATRARGRRRAV